MSARLDLAGLQFGQLTVLRRLSRAEAKALGKGDGSSYWECRCSCGRHRIVRGTNLSRSKIQCCTHCARRRPRNRRRLDVTGERYGMLVAVRLLWSAGKHDGVIWRFDCDCGGHVAARLKDVRYGNTLSCGCMKSPAGRPIGSPSFEAERPWRSARAT